MFVNMEYEIQVVGICSSITRHLESSGRFCFDQLTSLTHWGRMMHICVGNLTITGSDHGLFPGRRRAIIWTNAGLLLIGTWGTNFGDILIEIHTFLFKKMHLKRAFGKWRPFCSGLNELNCNVEHAVFTWASAKEDVKQCDKCEK